MALSLLCKDCDTLFRSVQEAQAHNEATGHSNFEESTKPVSYFKLRINIRHACMAAQPMAVPHSHLKPGAPHALAMLCSAYTSAAPANTNTAEQRVAPQCSI